MTTLTRKIGSGVAVPLLFAVGACSATGPETNHSSETTPPPSADRTEGPKGEVGGSATQSSMLADLALAGVVKFRRDTDATERIVKGNLNVDPRNRTISQSSAGAKGTIYDISFIEVEVTKGTADRCEVTPGVTTSLGNTACKPTPVFITDIYAYGDQFCADNYVVVDNKDKRLRKLCPDVITNSEWVDVTLQSSAKPALTSASALRRSLAGKSVLKDFAYRYDDGNGKLISFLSPETSPGMSTAEITGIVRNIGTIEQIKPVK